jgi:hypothetical protein
MAGAKTLARQSLSQTARLGPQQSDRSSEMIEVFAVGAAAAITGIAAKGLAPLARTLAHDILGSKASGHPQLPDAYWDERSVPESIYGPSIFSACLTWPHEGASFQIKVEFRYFVPAGRQRGILYRTQWGATIMDERRQLKILREVQQIALQRYLQPTLDAIARYNADQLRYKANLEMAAIEKSWLDALEADKIRVVADLQAGRPAQFSRDWHAEAVQGGAATTQQARKAALERILGNVEAVKQRLIQAAEKAERERTEAVRQAAEAVHRERQVQALRDSQAAEAAVEQARKLKLSRPIPLAMSSAGVVFGTDVNTGEDFAVPVRKIRHMLVGGMTGSGKSVFLHQLAYQLLRSAEVERVVLIDLKGGTEFDRYSAEPKAKVLWEFADVVRVFDDLVALLEVREAEMRSKGLRNWNGGRVFVIVDEYAEIHDSISDAKRGDQKEAANRLANNLKRIIRRARSLGVVMICALQKPTTDAMDSTLRANMNFRVCFRVKTRQSVEAALDDYEDLPVNPLSLRDGRFVFDEGRGKYRKIQTQIAPGVELGEDL